MKTKTKKICVAVSCLVGIVIATAATVLVVKFGSLIQGKIRKEHPLVNGSLAYKRWLGPHEAPIYMKFYFFHVKNPDEVEMGKKPRVQEKGPYVFRERRLRKPSHFDETGEFLYYKEYKSFVYEPSMTKGSLNDMVTYVNVPVIGISSKLKNHPLTKDEVLAELIYGGINKMFDKYEEYLFMSRPVRQLLFEGFRVDLLDDLEELAESMNMPFPAILPNNTFGFLYGKNNSNDGMLKINTGRFDIEKFGKVTEWDGNKKLDYWPDDYCNMINGTDGSSFTPGVTPSDVLRIFNIDFCRSAYLTFQKHSSVKGIDTLRFTVPNNFFKSPLVEPDNICFCTRQGEDRRKCNIDGLLDLSSCRKGAPVFMSGPHFYQASPDLLETIDGLKPIERKHEVFLDVEPMTGFVLQAARRIQINVEITPNPNVEITKDIKDTYIPVLWLEEIASVDDKSATMLKDKLISKIAIGRGVIIGFIAVGGIIAVLFGGVLFLLPGDKKKDEDPSPDPDAIESKEPLKKGSKHST